MTGFYLVAGVGTLACVVALLWLSILGYRDLNANRMTTWLSSLYRRPVDHGDEFVRERLRQNIWILSVLLALAAIVLIRGLLQ